MRRLAIALLLVLAVGACTTPEEAEEEIRSKEATVLVEAAPDVCWSGAIGGSTREGCGNGRFDVTGVTGLSAVVQNKGAGTLTVAIVQDGKETDRKSTTAEYGVVSVTGKMFSE